MIVFVDDEKWLIQAYIDELEWKSKKNNCFKPNHFFYGKEALDFLQKTQDDVRLLVVDIGMDYGDNDLTNKEPGGIQFLKELKGNPKLKDIPAIILTVYKQSDVEAIFPFESNSQFTFINRSNKDRDKILWSIVNKYCKK